MKNGSILGAAALLWLGACGNQPQVTAPEEQVAAQPVPEEVCTQAKDGLDKLSQTGGFEYTDQGEATIPDEVWLQMAPAQRDQLTQLLGFNAACSALEPPAQQNVRIRNEFGRVLAEQTVETSVDFSRLMQD